MDELEKEVLASQTPEGREIVARIIEDFDRNVGSFLTHEEIQTIVAQKIQETLIRGHHTKLLSRKHRARLEETTVLLHIEDRRTCILVDFAFTRKKRVGYTFATISYFPTRKGRIYVYRPGVAYPRMVFFTGHFFDRLIEREHAETNRNQIIFDFINQMHADKNGVVIATDEKRKKGMIFIEEGMGLGHVGMVDWKPAYGFGLERGGHENRRIPVAAIMTFVNHDMLFPEQQHLWWKYTRPMPCGNPACKACTTNKE